MGHKDQPRTRAESMDDLSLEKGCHASGVGAILPEASSHRSGLKFATSSPHVAKIGVSDATLRQAEKAYLLTGADTSG